MKFYLIPVCLFIILIFGGCKTAEQVYDIQGTWSVDVDEYGSSGSYTVTVPWTSTITFTGSETSGTATQHFTSGDGTGTYTINGDQIIIEITHIRPPNTFEYHYTGNILNDSLMSGTYKDFVNGSEGDAGTWTANKLNTS